MEAKIIKVHETGNVEQLAVENLSDKWMIFIQAGEIVKGGKQDRVLSQDMLLKPVSGQVPINSYCVEQGRWRKRGVEEDRVFSKSTKKLTSKALKEAALYKRVQGEVWKEVGKIQKKLSEQVGTSVQSNKSSSSLQLALENTGVVSRVSEYKGVLEPIIADHPDVIGYAFSINGDLNSADVYGSRALFLKLWPGLLEAAATEALAEEGSKRVDKQPETVDVQLFLHEAENSQVRKDPGASELLETREGKESLYQESRTEPAHSGKKSQWIHRNYLKRENIRQ
jgi:hypothetical protein